MKNTLIGILVLLTGLQLSLAQSAPQINYFTSFDDAKIAYTDEGSGQPVMLIHGFISDGSSWRRTELKKMLLSSGYRVIVPDLRGNGHSEKSHEEAAYRDDAEIKDLKSLASHLKLAHYFAVGYSRGSIVLAKLLTQTEAIDRAVIGGMGLDFTNPDWDRRIMFQHAFAGDVPLTPDTEGAINYAKSIGADSKILSLLQKYQPVTSVEALHQISIPVLVIAGDRDHENGNPADLANALPNSTLKTVPGTHNETHKTTAFAREVVDFFMEK